MRMPTGIGANADDLDALLPAMIADLAKERGPDQSWVPTLNGTYRCRVPLRGGSVRRLRRIGEAVLRERDLRATRN
jgi:ATP-dependent Lon protease